MMALVSRVLAAGVLLTFCARGAELAVEIPGELVPPGGMAQIKVFCSGRGAIASGRLEFALPADVFGRVQAADVFSAMGDALGLAYPLDGKFVIRFTSAAAGGCREAALPLAVLNVPVLPAATPGQRLRLALEPNSELRDAAGNTIDFVVAEGFLEVGGTLSLRGKADGAWDLPAGAEVVIEGTGFVPGTELDAGGVPIGPVRVLSREKLSFQLLAAAQLRGKRLQARTPEGALVETFIVPSNGEAVPQVLPILPDRTQLGAEVTLPYGPSLGSVLMLRNPFPEPVRYELSGSLLGLTTDRITGEIGGGQIAIVPHAIARSASRLFFTSRPLQVADASYFVSSDRVESYAVSQRGPSGRATTAVRLTPSVSEARFNVGDATPVIRRLSLNPSAPAVSFDWKIENDASWLRVRSTNPATQTFLELEIDPRGLKAGVYLARVLVTPAEVPSGEAPVTTAAEIRVRVGPNTELRVNPSEVSASGVGEGYSREVWVEGPPGLPFRATANQPWLTVTPAEGVSPARLTLRVQGLALPVSENLAELQVTSASGVFTVPISITKVRQLSDILHVVSRTNGTQRIPLSDLPIGLVPVSSATEGGLDWLRVEGEGALVNAGGLTAGEYRGSLRLEEPRGNASRTVPVVLTVWDEQPPPIEVTPIEVTLASGEVRDVPLALSLDGKAVAFSAEGAIGTTDDGIDWIWAKEEMVRLSAHEFMPAGVYLGVLPVQFGGQTVPVPIRMRIQGTVSSAGLRADEPSPASVFDSELKTADAVTAGGIVRIYGDRIGPEREVFRDLYRVYFDGEEAQVLEASRYELVVMVPAAVAGRAFTAVTVEAAGMPKVINVPVRVTPGL